MVRNLGEEGWEVALAKRFQSPNPPATHVLILLSRGMPTSLFGKPVGCKNPLSLGSDGTVCEKGDWMGVQVDEGLIGYMAKNSGGVHVEIRDSPAQDRALAGLNLARKMLFSIPHPEEPDDPLPSFVSDIEIGERGPSFWFDIADAEVYDGLLDQVLGTIEEALKAEGVEGRLTWPDALD